MTFEAKLFASLIADEDVRAPSTLIPAFFFFGKGFSDVLQAQQIRRRIKQAALNNASTESLSPASVVDVLKKTLSGELALPSVTERTTRDLN